MLKYLTTAALLSLLFLWGSSSTPVTLSAPKDPREPAYTVPSIPKATLTDLKNQWPQSVSSSERDTSNDALGNVDLAEILQGAETSISGSQFEARLSGLLPGFQHAKHLINNQTSIPVEWRPYTIHFPGNVFVHPRGKRAMPSIGYSGGRWRFGWEPLTSRLDATDRVLLFTP